MDHLISIFFAYLQPYMPLLHKPTFLENIRQGVHLKDEAFGSVVLLVLATASRHSQDPRVLHSEDSPRTSAGWKYFEQVNVVKNAIYHVPTLYDLQLCVLIVVYSLGTSVPQTAWTIVGVGVRFAVEIGVHRRKPEGHKLTMEDELRKRAFWILLSLDRTICLFLGRPSILRDEDFDLELPVDCDDEYWIIAPNGEVTFQQPPDKPSSIVFFNQHLKLVEILAFVLRTIYSIKKSRVMLGLTGKDWEQKLVRDLDSALNSWMDQVPDHLRWDPHRENRTFFLQSGTLWMVYYLVQIQIHRPFINTDSPLSFSSLAICTNAARSCCHVIDTQYRSVGLHYPYSMFGAFICGIVLSMNIWSGKRSGLALSLKKEIADVKRCQHILECSSVWWNVAGRLCDMLTTISSFGEANLPDTTNEVSLKRSREVAELPDFMTDYNSATDVPSYLLQSVPPGGCQYPDPAISGMSIVDVFAQDAFAGDFNFTPLGNETVDMWTGAPTGFSWEEWGSYIANTNDPLAMT
ncbi:hypothetical protein BDZ89DRAFT_526471 [Hymenopellis radicata]|nr:hypothetical protein BDZ89DRAFT_526471 [Hymenopellis radicata]